MSLPCSNADMCLYRPTYTHLAILLQRLTVSVAEVILTPLIFSIKNCCFQEASCVWCWSRKTQRTFILYSVSESKWWAAYNMNVSHGSQWNNGRTIMTHHWQLLAARNLILMSSFWQPEDSEISLTTMIEFHWVWILPVSLSLVVVVCVFFVLSLPSWCSYHVGGIYFSNPFCLFVMIISILKKSGKFEKFVYYLRYLNTIT